MTAVTCRNPAIRQRLIRAVNAHDALVAACEAARRHGTLAETDGWSSVTAQLDAALALAKGESQ